jgi:CRP-like cAMP-binding protein
MKLADFLKQEIQLPIETIQSIDNLWKYEELPKGAHLLKEGSLSQQAFFVEKGLLRLYYLKDGKDITHFFFSENNIYVPIENVFLNLPYPYNLELLENSIIRTVDFPIIKRQLDENIKLYHFVLHVAVSTIKQLAEHLYALQFQSAQERYKLLLKNHPKLLLRSPLGHIASYLNITQSTLSKIRASV